ncbi:MAG: tRNA uridine-5-carboxymethylaminomethyl(34) synthesis GTPase MnmE [Candidatus Omnitrophica bacterium]|nr:tRNA uridine-5-carboxymethylaminomethyl(34) synthesis GTPase MnmE [Candidatus Omnitrophota bacterium]
MSNFNLKDYNTQDTIAAIATFVDRSALGVIKISGRKSIDIVHEIFKPCRKKNIKKAKTYTLHYGWVVDRQEGKGKRVKARKYPQSPTPKSQILNPKPYTLVDEVLVSIMRKPRTYTREDVVEISSHGGVTAVNKILEIILQKGARLALPGEFTYRALLNKRIDLIQAESISGIVEAKTFQSLSLALNQLNGQASDFIKKLKEEIKDLFMQTEAWINFPEEDLGAPLKDFINSLKKTSRSALDLLKGVKEAGMIRQGLKCVICGKTNVGKSTLFNRLLKEERVIVSKAAGTTRDVVEDIINIRGVPLRIYDTAGILEPSDFITRKAVEKTSEIFDKADLAVLLLDGSRKPNDDDLFLLRKINSKNAIIAINKIDLAQKLDLKSIFKGKASVVRMSALKNIGLADLEKAIYNNVYKVKLNKENLIFLSNYQVKVLEDISQDLEKAVDLIKKGYTIDYINIILKECLNSLGKLTGEVLSQEVLESIFSNFCIGK